MPRLPAAQRRSLRTISSRSGSPGGIRTLTVRSLKPSPPTKLGYGAISTAGGSRTRKTLGPEPSDFTKFAHRGIVRLVFQQRRSCSCAGRESNPQNLYDLNVAALPSLPTRTFRLVRGSGIEPLRATIAPPGYSRLPPPDGIPRIFDSRSVEGEYFSLNRFMVLLSLWSGWWESNPPVVLIPNQAALP